MAAMVYVKKTPQARLQRNGHYDMERTVDIDHMSTHLLINWWKETVHLHHRLLAPLLDCLKAIGCECRITRHHGDDDVWLHAPVRLTQS